MAQEGGFHIEEGMRDQFSTKYFFIIKFKKQNILLAKHI
jgi:hypothetical protein